MTFREFEPCERDYALMAALSDLEWPEWPDSAEEIRREDALRQPGAFFQRAFAELDGKAVACYTLVTPRGRGQSGVLDMQLMVSPEFGTPEIEAAVCREAARQAEAQGVPLVTCHCRDDRPARLKALEGEGFSAELREPVSGLDLTSFDATAYAPVVERVKGEGIVIASVAGLERAGVEWKRSMWELRARVMLDVPTVRPPFQESFEQFCQLTDDPVLFNPESKWVAHNGERIVGKTSLYLIHGKPENAATGLTGVLPEYRRRGIATAVKACALEWARSQGVRTVYTGNEEGNPMYQLNLAMGYRTVFSTLSMVKRSA